jgi:starch phosphorylase
MTLGAADHVVDVRTGLQADALRQAIVDHLRYSIGRPASVLTPAHYYRALALAVRDRVQHRH